ncbi:MobC family plasmid mobilization relaxosome protein [Nocardia sp. NPDC004151]|uniref:MobC family plasmid mobilization relaxosome protein n=1 Tax=Nocardia sp. NPDC004151 TaxID=3364304 RepID=UPI0036CD1CF0
MVAEQGVAGSLEGRARGSQNLARARRRRRRPNIEGKKQTLEVVFSEAEFAKVQALADEVDCTVPWFVVQAAVYPAPASSKGDRSSDKPWLPWPQRKALSASLMSATGALDEVRLEQLAKIGSNLNQIAHVFNADGVASDEIAEVLEAVEELRETMTELRERAERMEELAREAVRR